MCVEMYLKIKDSSKLQRCPFCEEQTLEIVTITIENLGLQDEHVRCLSCGAMGPASTGTDAIQSWNARGWFEHRGG